MVKEKILVPKYVQYALLPAAILLALWFISTVRSIVLLFILASILAFVLDVPVSFLQDRLRLPRLVATLAVWLVIIAIVGGLLMLIVPLVINELNNFLDNLPAYADRVQKLVQDIQDSFRHSSFPLKPDITASDVSDRLVTLGESAATTSLGVATTIGRMGFNAFLILVISVYMLIDARRLKRAVKNVFPEKFRPDAIHLFSNLQRALGSYLRGQFIISSCMGIIGGTIAWYGGGGYAAIVGVWVFLTEVIPFIGPFLGMVPAVILAWLAGGPLHALMVTGLFLAAQQLEGQVLVPKIMGRSVGVHPLWVMFAVLSGATFGGLIGALLAVPTVAVVRTLVIFAREEMALEKWDRPLLEKTGANDAESV
ncbi:MAG: AI-2E family transporter [Thermoleophilia bacterium]